MKKSIKNMKKVVLAIIFCITLLMPISVSAEEYSQNSSETAVQLNEIIEEKDSVIQERDQQIEELIEQNNRNQKTIEDYRALYSIWTAVIGTLFVLFGIILPIVITIGLDKWNKRDIKNEVEKMQKESQKQYERLMMAQNAWLYHR